jgi:antitoxin (DNA-binding transcriptional repressor) of toxin-antitoxin stability system
MASNPIDLKQAQSRLRELVEKAGRGEEVILAEGGKAVAKIVPFGPPSAKRRFGSARGLIRVGPDFDAPLEDMEEYE